jgi:putative transposase
MAYDPEIHHRKSIRLKEFDYSQPGAYFITTNIQTRKKILCQIIDGRITLNKIGRIVETVWKNLPLHYPSIKLDEYSVMPDHFHGLIVITDFDDGKRQALSEIVRGFKSFSSREVNRFNKTTGKTLWQRNYYEHVVRDEDDLNRIRQYISNNPLCWSDGKDNIEPSEFFQKKFDGYL